MNNILIKYPTRNRVDKFYQTLGMYQKNLSGNNNVRFLITIDESDTSNYEWENRMRWNNVILDKAPCKSKIEAINSGIDKIKNWDILLLASDDMIPVRHGFDDIIVNSMLNLYPDKDGVLWFNDGYVGNRLNTLALMGRRYYDRFNYIYHPDYKSLWADNEFMDVANRLNKQTYMNDIIIRHEHPNNTRGIGMDNMYRLTESFYHSDKAVYLNRKRLNFGL